MNAQTSSIWKGLEKGNYDIGFKTLNLVDHSRQIELDSVQIARPIQISVWYPSQIGTNKMNLNKYYVNFGLYRDFGLEAKDELADWARKKTVEYIYSKTTNDSTTINKLFQIETEAFFNSPLIDEQFPLVFLMANVSTDLFLLAEYLASHGYIVVSKYSDGLITNKWEGWDTLGNSVNNDMIDINLIINFLSNKKYIDFQNVALVGYHGNTEALILHQIENRNVKAVVSLDGGEVWSFNAAHKNTIKNHPAWKPSKVTCPYLRIHSDIDLENSMDLKHADWWFYEETSNPVTFINIHDLNHYDFMSFLNCNHIVRGLTGTKNKHPVLAHKAICNYVLHFLNSNVKDSSSSKLWLKNTTHKNGFPKIYWKSIINQHSDLIRNNMKISRNRLLF